MADLLTEQQVLNAVYDPTTGMLKVNVAGMTFEGEVNVDDVLISNPVGNPVNVKLPDGAQAVLDTNSGDIKTAAQAISAILATVIGENKTLPVSGTVSETNSAAIKDAAEAVQAAVEASADGTMPLTIKEAEPAHTLAAQINMSNAQAVNAGLSVESNGHASLMSYNELVGLALTVEGSGTTVVVTAETSLNGTNWESVVDSIGAAVPLLTLTTSAATTRVSLNFTIRAWYFRLKYTVSDVNAIITANIIVRP